MSLKRFVLLMKLNGTLELCPERFHPQIQQTNCQEPITETYDIPNKRSCSNT